MKESFRHIAIASRFGAVELVWAAIGGRPTVVRVLIPRGREGAAAQRAELFRRAVAGAAAEIRTVAEGIAAFLAGEPVAFTLDALAMDRCTVFQERILREEFAVPRGAVTTYRRLAASAGAPGGARAAGRALATNPFPLIIPCHRAIRSDGSLGGYQGGLAMKRALLEMEGVLFDASGRVRVERLRR